MSDLRNPFGTALDDRTWGFVVAAVGWDESDEHWPALLAALDRAVPELVKGLKGRELVKLRTQVENAGRAIQRMTEVRYAEAAERIKLVRKFDLENEELRGEIHRLGAALARAEKLLDKEVRP